MGVSGSGKSTIGKLLAQDLDIPFFDGDDFHPQQNIQKMSEGKPLTDVDRQGWLESLNKLAIAQLKNNSCVIVCSALKQKYRDILNNSLGDKTLWIHLQGSFELIQERVQRRADHFMPTALLQSQFEILEKPKNAIEISVDLSPNKIIEIIKNQPHE